jgi:crotonobetainyl-CoA:carnitine CoA-transferase CaiB-like acyl-CoA transferase
MARSLDLEPSGPLKGVKILDLTSVVFGAYATQMLGDLGADVIKVESPNGDRGGGGDIMRWTGTPPEGWPADLGPIFLAINRNKRSVLLDLSKPSAQKAMRKLIQWADVFAASVRYDGMKRLSLGYEEVAAIKPDIIYVHGSGYGADGPYAGEPAYDDLIQSASGLADLLPRTDDNPAPRLLPSLIADKVSGLFMSQAILAALYHRQRTGEGQFVEVPMFECITSFNLAEHMFGQTFDPPSGPWGYSRVVNPNRKPHATKDGHIGLLPYSDKQWEAFFRAAGVDELADDPRFSTQRARSANYFELYGILGELTRTKTTAEWLALLKPLHIPVNKTNRLEDLPNDPHLKAVGFFERYEHPHGGAYYQTKPPLRFSKTPANIRRHPPRLGEHTDEVTEQARPDPSA